MTTTDQVSRRSFLQGLAAGSLAGCASRATGGPAAPGPKRPNILLLLADNWAWPHASACGDKVVKTPNFDGVARNGILLTRAFCQVPSCSPARAVLLTGQTSHRLGPAASLWGEFPKDLPTYPAMLKAQGYAVGYAVKGWGPGLYQGQRNTVSNPAGPNFKSFEAFLDRLPKGKGFCFWFGSHEPHQPWTKGGDPARIRPADVAVPPYLPDHPTVRKAIADYYAEVELFDRQVGQMLALLKARGLLNNTLVVVAGDNGWQTPRGLANCYDVGTHVPMAVQWPGHIPPGRTVKQFVSFEDIAPTFLDAAGLKPHERMTGRSLLPLMRGEKVDWPDCVFLERERHANVRAGDLGYPCRAIRTAKYLYIWNIFPDRWPAGDPKYWKSVGPYGDMDNTPFKQLYLQKKDDPAWRRFIDPGMAKRPAEELYDLAKDPWQMHNVAADEAYAEAKRVLRRRLEQWMARTKDPRAAKPTTDVFDRYRYYGPPRKRVKTAKPRRRRGVRK